MAKRVFKLDSLTPITECLQITYCATLQVKGEFVMQRIQLNKGICPNFDVACYSTNFFFC